MFLLSVCEAYATHTLDHVQAGVDGKGENNPHAQCTE